jgi:hypothetical protein
MAISFASGGTASAGTTQCTPAYTATAAGDYLLLFVASKYPTNYPTTPSGWTFLGRQSGGAGSNGADSGNVTISVYERVADGTETGTVTVDVTSGNSCSARIFRFTAAAGSRWSTAVGDGADNAAGTSWSVSISPSLDLAVDDMLVACSAVNGDTTSYSAQAFNAVGITFGSETERMDAGSTQGDDHHRVLSTHMVTAGSGTPALTYTMTAAATSGNTPAGATVAVRLRELPLQTLSPSGIGSSAALGSPAVTHVVGSSGIASGAALGTPLVGLEVEPAGIASGAVAGAPAATLVVGPSGIASSASVGTPSISGRVGPTGVPSAAAVGAPKLTLSVAVPGIASGASVPGVFTRLTVFPPSIPSTMVVSGPIVTGGVTAPTAQKIREAIRSILVAAATDAGDRVFTNRAEAWGSDELPAIGIYARGEQVELSNEAPREYQRDLLVGVELLLFEAPGGVGDDELDDFERDVFAALALHESANDNADRSWYRGTKITATSRGSRRLLVARMDWIYRYHTMVDELIGGAQLAEKIAAGWSFPIATDPAETMATDEVLTNPP